jgi:hypothetical protein
MATAGLLPESDRASRAKARSEEDWKRCSGLFSRQRCTTRCRPGGAALTTYEIAGGSSCKTAVIVSADVDLANARLPRNLGTFTTLDAMSVTRLFGVAVTSSLHCPGSCTCGVCAPGTKGGEDRFDASVADGIERLLAHYAKRASVDGINLFSSQRPYRIGAHRAKCRKIQSDQ